ncbi:hypothetical protein BG000_002805 [Podila horticola]|nr:hypothetical protein BG000_002805 [Podila horticola]
MDADIVVVAVTVVEEDVKVANTGVDDDADDVDEECDDAVEALAEELASDSCICCWRKFSFTRE